MSELLSADELAYMRATQADARPTAVLLQRRRKTRVAGGEWELVALGASAPMMMRVWDTPDEVPAVLADRYEGGTLVKLSLDILPDVRSGDLVTHTDGTALYELVSEGTPDAWATAQLVWATRWDRPART